MSPIQRAGLLALASLSLFAASAGAQVPILENFAGNLAPVDRPATQVAVSPYRLTMGPDGRVYMINFFFAGVYRFDPANGTVTALPGLPGTRVFQLQNPHGIAFDAAGNLLVVGDSRLTRLDLETGVASDVAYNLGDFVNGLAIDAAGNIYTADTAGNDVKVIRPSGQVERIAGTGTAGFSGDGGPALLANLDQPSGVALDAAGNLYISDAYNHRIRRVSAADGTISTFAGTGLTNYNGDGLPPAQTNFGWPEEIKFLADGSLLVSANNRVRRIAGGVVTTFAGNGVSGFSGDGGPATAASLIAAEGFAQDAAGNVYISDINTRRLRRVDASTGIITTVAGNGTIQFCGDGGPAVEACMSSALSLVVDPNDNLLFGDLYNSRIRKVSATTGIVTSVAGIDQDTPYAGDGGLAVNTSLNGNLWGIGRDPAGNIYGVVNYSPRRVYKIDAQTGTIRVFAGTREFGFSGDGGPATAARLQVPGSIVFDAAGNAYISDQGTNRVRKVDAVTGIITTIAGSGATTSSNAIGDGGPAVNASLWAPTALAIDPNGNLLIGDDLHCRIRKVDLTTHIITTFAGNGGCSPSGNNVPALSASIGRAIGLAYSPYGELYFSTYSNIRKVDASGIVSTVLGDGMPLDNRTTSPLGSSYGLAFDSAGRLYITNPGIRRVSNLPVPAPRDTTAPVITPNVSGTAGNLGWYRSDVQLSWSVSDAESAVSSSSGCTTTSVTTDTSGVTFTCSATSKGGTATRSVTIKRDTVAPTLDFGAATPAADAAGYHSGDVSFPFTVADDLSGVYTTSTANPVVISGEGLHLTSQVVVTDQAGNSATFTTPEVSIERSPPVITPSVVGTSFFDDWYVTNVEVSFTVNDPQSPILSQDGCAATMVTQDTSGTTFTCTATSSGGTASASVTVKRDATPPTVTLGTPSPAAGPNGWYTGAVSIPWTVSDELSGFAFADLPNPIVINEEGTGITRKLSVRDAARNWVIVDTPPINVDFSPPSIQPTVTGTLGNNGWYTSDVQVTWAISEVPQNILSRSGCDDSIVNTDIAGVTLTCSVVSGGGTATSSVTLKRDATPPVLSFGTPSPAPNASGWNKTNVSIAFTRSDALSGVASTSVTSPLVISTEGANVTGQVVVTDNAGNSATFTSVPRNIDKTVPVIDFPSPADGGDYGLYQEIFANYTCNDVSLLSCTSTVAQGDLVTKTGGSKSMKVTAKDAVGFTTISPVHYYWVDTLFNWSAFTAPSSAPPALNLVTRGTVVPIRWQLPDGRGGYVKNTASFTSATVGSLTCGSAPVVSYPDTSVGPAGISYDEATRTFTYNWATDASWTGCRKLTIKLKDNTTHELRFKLQ